MQLRVLVLMASTCRLRRTLTLWIQHCRDFFATLVLDARRFLGLVLCLCATVCRNSRHARHLDCVNADELRHACGRARRIHASHGTSRHRIFHGMLGYVLTLLTGLLDSSDFRPTNAVSQTHSVYDGLLWEGVHFHNLG